jgi:hypothetical protein
MLLVIAQVAGQEESIGPIAAGRERLRAERRWRRWAIAGWTLFAGIVALGIWDFAETGEVSVYTAFIAALLAYSLTVGKEHLRRLDHWMAANLRPSRRVSGSSAASSAALDAMLASRC